MAEVLVVAVAGALGAAGRWGLGRWDQAPADGWPWGTLAANLVGCAALGVVSAAPVGDLLRTALAVGLLGGLTTFSTVVVQVRALGRVEGPAYAAVSLVAGVVLVVLGGLVGGRL